MASLLQRSDDAGMGSVVVVDLGDFFLVCWRVMMDRDTVVRLARESGFFIRSLNSIDGDEIFSQPLGPMITDELTRFATLVRNAALEEAAVKCEGLWHEEVTAAVNGTQQPKYHDCIECSYAIRALKEQ